MSVNVVSRINKSVFYYKRLIIVRFWARVKDNVKVGVVLEILLSTQQMRMVDVFPNNF